MAKNSARDIEVKAFATHQVITQPNPLRKVLRRVEEKDMDDPIGRAEQALAGLSGEFKSWMTTEVNRLSSAYVAIRNDGFNKARTTIGENAFIGSHTALVAPVTVGDGAYVATGSVITADVPADALSIARARQVDKPGRAKELRARLKAQKS